MQVVVRQETTTNLSEYARIPSAFEVRRILDCTMHQSGLCGFTLIERELDVPYFKNYDLGEGGGPESWETRFDISNWGLFSAWVEGQRVGGAAVAYDTSAMLSGRRDVAVLWDIRIAPDIRRGGIGSALFQAATQWAVTRNCSMLKVETQNINVPACRFYARQGYALAAIDRMAYPLLPDEIRLVWFKQLSHHRSS